MRLVTPGEAIGWEPIMPDAIAPVILVVDEEPQILQLVRVILSRQGYRVVCARSIRQATRLCRRSNVPVSLVLVDALTAEAEDPDWRRRLEGDRPGPKVIIMSAASPAEGSLPGHAFLAKPFSPAALCEIVERAFKRGLAAGSV